MNVIPGSWRNCVSRAVIGAALACVVSTAVGQDFPLPSHTASVRLDSGFVRNEGGRLGAVYTDRISVPGAIWLRLNFAEARLAGSIRDNAGSFLIITSEQDGKWQYLNAEHVEQWQNTSAYFNGDAVTIELWAYPGAEYNRLLIEEVTAGDPVPPDRTICDGVDDRVLSNDPRQGRYMSAGCTAWLIDDCQHCFLTAGHCSSGNTVVQFNVPLSGPTGTPIAPGPEDQYAKDPNSQYTTGSGGQGNDYSYFGVFPNSNTGLKPHEAQGAWYTLGVPAAPQTGEQIRITGYGTTSSPVSPTWSQAQKTHVGPYSSYTFSGTNSKLTYRTDTTGGNSGSPVVLEQTGLAIGIHTHGGCTSTGGANVGTGVSHTGLVAALAAPLGVCAGPCIGLSVSPAGTFDVGGNPGGPFAPASIVYTLTNVGDDPINYSVGVDANWVSLSAAGGTLGGNATTDVTVSINAFANLLDVGNFVATVSFTNLSGGQGNAMREVHLAVGGPQPIHTYTLDANPGWTTGPQWQFGTPTGQGGASHGQPDPTAGFTGSSVYGINLSGDYTLAVMSEPSYLTMGPFACSEATGVTLKFKRWLNSDYQPYVTQLIQASNNGTTWTTIWQNGNSQIADSAWQSVSYDMSAVADHQDAVWLRWGHKINQSSAWAYSGWNIDDVEVWGLVPFGPPVCLGDVNCDGVVDFNDINPFVEALGYPGGQGWPYPCRWIAADCNIDGNVTFADINAFVARLGATCD